MTLPAHTYSYRCCISPALCKMQANPDGLWRLHFTNFSMVAVHHLGLVGGIRGTTHEGPFMVAISCDNIVTIGFHVIRI